MTCDSCVKAVSDSLYQLKGITKVDANLKDQLVSVEGTGTPSFEDQAHQTDDAAAPLKNDADTLVGVVARSAGMWDNDKTVCSCTGKTLWEERQDEVKKGML
ncbi:hypothetical protein BN1708_005123 [Verticillium longisporum]|uniref:Superoxide dismutase 1 copper chaperone n=1 Tax=Verticillium longisporum TaxID=100787 RepID=A0A0G4M6S1_VERLO|nr:hypothetical protein BN1708_005123 [Verticillium longisporum]